MFNFWPVYKREVKAFFQSPATYVALGLIFLITGTLFWIVMYNFSADSQRAQQMAMYGQPGQGPNITVSVIGTIFSFLSAMFIFTIPILTMRLVSEEKSRGTFELLVTCPIGDWAILLGKYFALLTVGVFITALSSVFPLLVAYLGKANQVAPEWAVVRCCWTGLFLIYAAYAAFGLMASSFTENQVIAAVFSLLGILLWHFLGGFPMGEGASSVLKDALVEISASTHIENFNKGVVMLKDFVFFILAAYLFLFVASKTLEARRWRI